MTDFTAYNSTTHKIIKCEDDYNNLLSHGLEKTAAYIVRKNGSYYEAIKGGSATGAGTVTYGGSTNAGAVSGADADAVMEAAATAAVNGKLYIKAGAYGTITVSIPDGVDLEIEQGVPSTVTFSFAADYSGIVFDYRSQTVTLYNGGVGTSLAMQKQSGGNIYNRFLMRPTATNDMPLLLLSPNGAGYTSGPSTWTSSIQLANTDISAVNGTTNFEIAEWTWENNYNYINVYKGGTGTKRGFAILLEAENVQIWSHGLTGTYGVTGQFFSWFYHPIGFATTNSGTWASPLDLTNLGAGKGSAGNPCATPAMIVMIPQNTILGTGSTAYDIYNSYLSTTGIGIVSVHYENKADRNQVLIESVAEDRGWETANKMRIYAFNVNGGNYTTQGAISMYIELRY